MSEFHPVSTKSDLDLLDAEDMVDGYFAGWLGEPEPGSNKSRGYWHGWRNGLVDSGRAMIDPAQRQLAAECYPGRWRN